MIQGKVKLQYNRLWDFCETITTCFHRLCFSLATINKGFRASCMPIIGLDRCFLKGTYKGQLLSAILRDDNNNMYPVTLAVVEAETKDSWI
jgi:hypothetical protein